MMRCGNFKILWTECKRERVSEQNLAYPDGEDLDFTYGRTPSCTVRLTYPAAGCGLYRIKCEICGAYQIAAAAGRRDDPRTVTVACRRRGLGASEDTSEYAT